MKKIVVLIMLLSLLTACNNIQTYKEIISNIFPTTSDSLQTIDENDSIFQDESTVNSDIDKEVVFFQENYETEKHQDKSMYDAITFYTVEDSTRNASLINAYLVEREMNIESSDGVFYYNELKIGEYYINENKGKISFILRMWDNYHTSPKLVAINCTTVDMNDFDPLNIHNGERVLFLDSKIYRYKLNMKLKQ